MFLLIIRTRGLLLLLTLSVLFGDAWLVAQSLTKCNFTDFIWYFCDLVQGPYPGEGTDVFLGCRELLCDEIV
jgi:hypothetical protein